MSPEVVAAAVGIAFLASFCMSTTGFGFALTMTPLLTLAWNVREAVATSVILSLMNQGPLIFEIRSHVVPSRVVVLLAGFVAGTPAGLYLFDRLDTESLKIFVAVTVIVAGLVLFFTPRLDIKDSSATPLGLVAGILSGALGASTSLSGPPVVVYLLGRHQEIETFRATILSYFLPAGLVTASAFAILGRVTGDVLLVAAAAVPAMAAGMLSGMWLRRRLDAQRFRSLVLGVLVLSSAGVLASTLT